MESSVTHIKLILSPGQAILSGRSVELIFGIGGSSTCTYQSIDKRGGERDWKR